MRSTYRFYNIFKPKLTVRKSSITTNSTVTENVAVIPETFEDKQLSTELIKLSVLEKVPESEDLSFITPNYTPAFNLAAYVNKSEPLQNLVHLGVDLSKIEKKTHIVPKLLMLDLQKAVEEHVLFLKHYVDADEIGNFITKNPLILCEAIEDLEVRVNYLTSKNFAKVQIQRVVSKNPFWLMYSTKRIDRRLGHFQKTYDLAGHEVRHLAARQPKLITYNLHHVRTNTFVIKEELGFEDSEVKKLLLQKPKLFMVDQLKLKEKFNYFHHTMKIPHTLITEFPGALLCRLHLIKQRHLFLEKLGRAQFDPQKENYVSLKGLVEGTDVEFCKQYAKCLVDDFNLFLKTL